LRERVATLPGVQSVAFAGGAPFFASGWSLVLRRPSAEPAAPNARALVVEVDAGYFAALGLPILRGRDFAEGDVAGAPLVAAVSEDFARAARPGEDALGRTLETVMDSTRVPVTVVGVTSVVRSSPFATRGVGVAYMSRRQMVHATSGVLIVRASGHAARLAPVLRSTIMQVDSQLPVGALQTFDAAHGASLGELMAAVGIARAASLLALVLACLGVYAIIAFNVVQRSREVAIRMALGARAVNLITLFMSQIARLAVYGLVLGIPFGMAVRLALSNTLGDVALSAGTAVTIAGVALTLLVTALLASLLPARRAARVRPFQLLRADWWARVAGGSRREYVRSTNTQGRYSCGLRVVSGNRSWQRRRPAAGPRWWWCCWPRRARRRSRPGTRAS
jgi:ABC-type antimicrobial peptide transport system permease subunit